MKEEGCFFEAIYLVDEARKPFAAKIKRPKNQTNQLVGAYYTDNLPYRWCFLDNLKRTSKSCQSSGWMGYRSELLMDGLSF
jgi:hypothetical protein